MYSVLDSFQYYYMGVQPCLCSFRIPSRATTSSDANLQQQHEDEEVEEEEAAGEEEKQRKSYSH